MIPMMTVSIGQNSQQIIHRVFELCLSAPASKNFFYCIDPIQIIQFWLILPHHHPIMVGTFWYFLGIFFIDTLVRLCYYSINNEGIVAAPSGPYDSDSVLFGLRARFGTFWTLFQGPFRTGSGFSTQYGLSTKNDSEGFSGGSELSRFRDSPLGMRDHQKVRPKIARGEDGGGGAGEHSAPPHTVSSTL